ncbi:hypothetical protein BT69DRAFT_1328633 [Atractiella rhizophila]|nr:hypothetical protein BT69DRAFT_1328633 [Atractiella rhizophila]
MAIGVDSTVPGYAGSDIYRYALGDDEEDPLGMDIDGDELAESLEQNKKMDPKGKKSTRTTNSMSCQVWVSTLYPLLRDSTSTMNADQVQNHVLSKKQNPVWLFYTVISKSEAHPDAQNGHLDGTTYIHNGKLMHLEEHLTGSPRYFKKTSRFFKLWRKKYEDKVAIMEDEQKMAMNHTPGMAARFADQAFDQTKFDQLLVHFFVATDQLFLLMEDPHFCDLLHYLQYTYPTMKPQYAAIPAKGTSWNSGDEDGATEEEMNPTDKRMKLPMRRKLREKAMKKGDDIMQELKKEMKEADTTINLALDAWTSENGFPFSVHY